jgi:hypothetical protein
MNRLLCFLTGGHRYSGIKLRCKVVGDEIVYNNLCLKCGKMFEVRLPKSAIIPKWMEANDEDSN